MRSANEHVGSSEVDMLKVNGRYSQALLRVVRQRNEGGTVGCSLFLCFLSCLENWYIFFVSGGGGKAEMARLNV